MAARTEEIDYIRVIDINDHLACFYWGRHKNHYHIEDALAAGELTWWEPYAEVHAKNINTIRNGNW